MRRLTLLVIAAGLVVALTVAASAPAHVRSGVSARAQTMPATMIACFDKKTRNLIDKTDPGNCEIAGYEDPHGRTWVRTPVRGIKWEEWGVNNSRGTAGIDTRSGAEIRLFAYRRIRCGDGRTFYSEANVVNLKTGHFFYVRLPICDDPAPRVS
jgi:hypothetical protein